MERLMRIAAALAAALGLAGCSLQPLYERPASPVAATFPGEATSPTEAQTDSIPAAAVGWQDFLADARLQRLVSIALVNNRDLRVAMLNVAEVQAQFRLQNSALYPQVTAGLTGSQSRSPGSLQTSGKTLISHASGVELDAAWEVDLFGRLRSLSDAAFQQYLASAHARQAAEILLVSQVADQYLATLALEDKLAVTRKTMEAAQEAVTIVRRKLEVGTASELDVAQSETVVEQARMNEADQLRLWKQAQDALVLLIGEPMPDNLPRAVALGDQAIRDDVPAGLPSDLIGRRPDIMQAEAQLRAENADIGAARAAFFPRITLTGAFGTESSTLSGLFGAGSRAWSFVPALAAPIFNAGANRANLAIATAEKDIGIAHYEKTVQTAFREVADGLAARSTYAQQLAAAQRLAATQQRRLGLARVRYESGINSYLDVLTAQTDLYDAELALVTVRLNRLSSLIDLYRALGGGWISATGDKPRMAGDLE